METRDLVGAVQRADVARLTAHSRHRQEDRRAHRARAEGSRRAALRRARGSDAPRVAGRSAARRPASRRSQNLGYHRPLAEKAVDAALRSTPDATFEDALKQRAPGADASDRRSPGRPAGPADDEAQDEAGLRPRSLDEYIGQDRIRDNLQVSIAAARGRARGARSRPALRSARARQDHARLRDRRRDGRARAGHRRAGDREAGRPGGDADQPAGARGAVHRRDPPAWRRPSRRSSIRRWRTTSSTSSSARAPARGR